MNVQLRAAVAAAAWIIAAAVPAAFADGSEPAGASSPTLNAIELGPDLDIYFLRFARMVSPKDELAIGAIYHNTDIMDMIAYPGSVEAFALEAGYRRYLWRGLHAEAALLPQYTICRDTAGEELSSGLGVAVEARLGYRFAFRLAGVDWLFNLQFFAGYRLIDPKPASFVEVDGGAFYVSPVPMFMLGFRF